MRIFIVLTLTLRAKSGSPFVRGWLTSVMHGIGAWTSNNIAGWINARLLKTQSRLLARASETLTEVTLRAVGPKTYRGNPLEQPR